MFEFSFRLSQCLLLVSESTLPPFVRSPDFKDWKVHNLVGMFVYLVFQRSDGPPDSDLPNTTSN